MQYNNYLHNIYIVLGIINISNLRDDLKYVGGLHKLYANTMTFFT